MNERLGWIREQLTYYHYQLESAPVLTSESNRYFLASHLGVSFLISFHDRSDYDPNVEAFRLEQEKAIESKLNPIPIFDSAVFFRPDIGKLEHRENPEFERRDLLKLELIAADIFKNVTYVSDSGLFVVRYGPQKGIYSPETCEGFVPRFRSGEVLKTIKRVESFRSYPEFSLSVDGNCGSIALPIPFSSQRINLDRGYQLIHSIPSSEIDDDPKGLHRYIEQNLVGSDLRDALSALRDMYNRDFNEH